MSHYGTLEQADDYHSSRGNCAWGELASHQKTAALVRGSDYVDQRYRVTLGSGRVVSAFCGSKSGGYTQEREWPRDGAKYYGDPIPGGAIPVEVINAAFEAALRESQEPGSLRPDYVATERVTEETVGPVTIKYASGSSGMGTTPSQPVVSVIDGLLAPLICPTAKYSGIGIRVV